MENSAKDTTGTDRKQDASQKRIISRNIHIIIEILIFIVLVGLTSVLLQPLRKSILRQMTETRDYFIGEAEAFLGMKIEYASMGPSIFAALDIRDIRVLHDDGTSVLSIGRLRIVYSLLDLIRGEKQDALRSIRIDVPVIDIDTERDADLLSLFSPDANMERTNPVSEQSWQGLDFLPDSIQVRLRGGGGTLRFGDNTVSVEGISFDGRTQNRRMIFTSRWSAETFLSGLINQQTNARMSGEISGDFAADLTNGNLNLTLPTLSGDFFSFQSITFNLALSSESIEFRKIKDRSPYDLFVRYDIDTNTLNGEFFADRFALRDILRFNGSLAPYNEWLLLETSGNASFVRNSDESIQYHVDLSGIIPAQIMANRAGDIFENLSFEIKGEGDNYHADFFPLRAALPQGSVFFEGGVQFPIAEKQSFGINGDLSIYDVSLTGENPLSADFTINTYGNEVSAFSDTVSFGGLALSAFDTYIIHESDELSFTISALRFQDIESYEDVSISRVNLDGSYDFNPRHLQASFSLDSFSVNDILQAASAFVDTSKLPSQIKNETKNMLVTTEVFLTTDFENVSYNAPRFIAAYSGAKDILSVVSVSGTNKRFMLNNGSILADNTLEFSGDADFSNINDVSFSFQAVYRDFSYFLDGFILDQRSFNINGAYGFNANLVFTDDGNYSGSIYADAIPIPFKNGPARLSLSAFMRWTDADFWSLDLDRFELSDLPLPGDSSGRFLLQGIADDRGATFSNIYFDDGKGTLTGTASADWMNRFSTTFGNILLSNQDGTEQYSIEARYENSMFDAAVSGFGMQLSRFIENTSDITASADASVHWLSPDAFSLGITVSSLTGIIGTNPINAVAEINADQDSALIHNTNVSFGTIDIDIPSVEIDLAESRLNGMIYLDAALIEKNIETGINADVQFKLIDSWFQIQEALNSFEGTLNVNTFLLNTNPVFDPFQFDVSKTAELLSIKGGPNEMLRFSMSNEGDFYAGFSNPAPLRGSIIGNITGGQIDAHTSKLYVDVPALFAVIPAYIKETLNVSSGFVNISVDIKGTLTEPEFFGSADGTSVRFQIPMFLTNDIGPTPIHIRFDGTEMSFGPLTARVDKGRAKVSGNFFFNGWVPNTFTINIDVDEDHPIPYTFEQDILKVRGNASGTLKLDLEGQNFNVEGDLTAYDTILTMIDPRSPVSVPQHVNPNPETYSAINLNITSGPRVEFLFPYETLPAVTAYADLGSKINIMADTRSETFSIKGDVGLRGGDVYYINRNFYIREGTVYFDENELDFNPLITVKADITEISQEGPVTISLILENDPVLSFNPRFVSNPALSQLEIMSLLGVESPDLISSISIFTDPFSQFLLTQRVQRWFRDFLHLDMFSARSQFLQNAIFLMTGLQTPENNSGNIGNLFDNTSVYIGKYITNDVFLQAMGTVTYDPSNDEFFGYGIEADIGLEFKSPLANIKFNINPPLSMRPENLVLDDLMSFTLSWKWTF